MSLGVALTVSLTPPAVGVGASFVNLLRWSEALANPDAPAVWSTQDVVTIFESNGPGEDEIQGVAPGARIWQIVSSSASTGVAATRAITLTSSYARYAVTGTFDGWPYTFSIELQDLTGGSDNHLVLRLDRFGGGLRCQIENAGGAADFLATRAQLEQASGFTIYQLREAS